ncbi:MAG: YhjD/YihY/BrkB family envelope integrity protein, partial [Cryobacterium sp.]
MKITALAQQVMAWRPVRVFNHFSDSRGAVLAAGMAFQSIFAVFAAIWVGFAIAGLWLTSNPLLTRELFDLINRSIPGLIGADGVIDPTELANASVLSWTGAVALVGLLATALGWLSTTAQAIRTIFGMPRDKTFFAKAKLRELILGLLFGLALVVSALVSLASTWALGAVFGLVGL